MNITQYIGLKKFSESGSDAHGNPVESWSDPVSIGVYGIGPNTSDEPFQSGRQAVVTGKIVYLPHTEVSRLDRLVINGEEYTIQGEPAVWNEGMFDYQPGMTLTIERVEG